MNTTKYNHPDTHPDEDILDEYYFIEDPVDKYDDLYPLVPDEEFNLFQIEFDISVREWIQLHEEGGLL